LGLIRPNAYVLNYPGAIKLQEEILIKTFTDFNRVALKRQLTPYIRVWYWLRHHEKTGSGWLNIHVARKTLSEIYSEGRRDAILRVGNGIWWEFDDGVLHLKSSRNIAKYLSTLPGNRVLIPIKSFLRLSEFKAVIYSTYFAQKPRTMARSTIKKIFGISPRTQIRYEKIAKIHVKRQLAYSKNNEEIIERLPVFDRLQDGEKAGVWTEDIDKDGELELVWQISNEYESTIPVFDRKVNKWFYDLGGADKRGGAEPEIYDRIYYSDAKKVARLYNAGNLPKGGVYNLEKKDRNGRAVYGYIPPLKKN